MDWLIFLTALIPGVLVILIGGYLTIWQSEICIGPIVIFLGTLILPSFTREEESNE